MTDLSVVLPCYNEADNLAPLLARYAAVWPADIAAELILVDNGSTDTTAAVLERLLPAFAFARSVRVPVNRGYGHGIHTGLQAARGDTLAFSHADQQCDPADVFAAYRLAREQPDPERVFVKGKRARRPLGPTVVTTGMTLLASAVLLMPLSDINAQPKLFPRSHLGRLTTPPDGFPFDLYALYKAHRAGLRVLTVPVVFGRRGHGQSKWAFSALSRWRTMLGMAWYIVKLRFAGG